MCAEITRAYRCALHACDRQLANRTRGPHARIHAPPPTTHQYHAPHVPSGANARSQKSDARTPCCANVTPTRATTDNRSGSAVIQQVIEQERTEDTEDASPEDAQPKHSDDARRGVVTNDIGNVNARKNWVWPLVSYSILLVCMLVPWRMKQMAIARISRRAARFESSGAASSIQKYA